jgi:glycosyltransferase involved in cell wall biosynthesis
MTATGPVVAFIGIHAGKRTNQPVSQNETLAALFDRSGYEVRRASAIKRPLFRTLHQILALCTWRRFDVCVIAVFSGRSFWMADYASLLAGKLRHRKVVFFLHGGNLPVYGPEHRAHVMRVFDRADLILAPSDFLADVFRPWGYDVRTIPNVLALERYRYDRRTSARPALMWMRTFHPHYDPLLAVEVLHRVAQVHPGVTMTMGGADHGLLQATKDRAGELGVLGQITFAGYLDAAGKAQAFADHDIFLNTNTVDNMPISVLEASACGLVPVATSVGGIPALLTDGVNSRLVPVGDADAMTAAVLELLEDPEHYRRLAAGARSLAEQSGWSAVLPRWQEELDLLFAGGLPR